MQLSYEYMHINKGIKGCVFCSLILFSRVVDELVGQSAAEGIFVRFVGVVNCLYFIVAR